MRVKNQEPQILEIFDTVTKQYLNILSQTKSVVTVERPDKTTFKLISTDYLIRFKNGRYITSERI